jgi:hypothetical protein
MFEANGVADRVTLVRRRSTSATLPELASVLVTETIGNEHRALRAHSRGRAVRSDRNAATGEL